MFGTTLLKYTDLIPRSNDAVGHRINDMAGNVESILTEKVIRSPYYVSAQLICKSCTVNMLC